MVSPKNFLKQILIARQHQKYTKAVISKTYTYDRWMREQEEKVEIEQNLKDIDVKYLTNEMENFGIEGFEKENEGYPSKQSSPVFWRFSFASAGGKVTRKGRGIFLSHDFFCKYMGQILKNTETELIVIAMSEGNENRIALPYICKKFLEQDGLILIYGDEDVEKNGVRETPWLKPDWSPDRFLSGFYFGSLVAVRRDALQEAYELCNGEDAFCKLEDGEKLYYLLFYLLKNQGAFAPRSGKTEERVCHLPVVLYHTKKEGYERVSQLALPAKAVQELQEELLVSREALLSIIIPSKDNPTVLFQCLDSLLKKTRTRHSYEIILVDNGSHKDNRKLIEEKAASLNRSAEEGELGGFRGITYLYSSMEFNFSAMCNLGAANARGELFLFLNDDIEIIQPDWLERMEEKVLLPYAGAVGAKLLYPGTDKIQHAGITNLRVGPAHKLLQVSDADVHYYGMNRGVHDMLAVTGACLMVRRDVFDKAGGFYEGLAVAFNDVDLCYTLYELGYYNIVRNDTVFYHHESLSRGYDMESEEKQLRLNREKDLLYLRHQALYGRDPFYHPYLTMDMLEPEYGPAYRYQVHLELPWSLAQEVTGQIGRAREDACLVVGMECAKDIYKWQYGVSPKERGGNVPVGEMGYYFQGYSFVIGADNACYRKKLLLKNRKNGKIWAISVEDGCRQDIKENLKDQLNVDLTGFSAKMKRDEIPEGVYQFGILAENVCSRERLVNWSNWMLENGGESGDGLSGSL